MCFEFEYRHVRLLHRVKPVLRGHAWDDEKWSRNTGDLLKVQFI